MGSERSPAAAEEPRAWGCACYAALADTPGVYAGDPYGARAEQVYNKAIAQAKGVFQRAKLSNLLTKK